MNPEAKFEELEKSVGPYKDILGKAADAIIDQNVSSYPVFVLHPQDVQIGLPLVNAEPDKSEWFIRASTLEELATKKIIEMARVDNFRSIYKAPDAFLCLLVFGENGATFVFLPRN